MKSIFVIEFQKTGHNHIMYQRTQISYNLAVIMMYLPIYQVKVIIINNYYSSSGIKKNENKNKIGKHVNNNESTRDSELTSSSHDAQSSSSTEKEAYSSEDKIAIILAEGLKERNAMLYDTLQRQIEILDNTSFTVTIQYEQK